MATATMALLLMRDCFFFLPSASLLNWIRCVLYLYLFERENEVGIGRFAYVPLRLRLPGCAQ